MADSQAPTTASTLGGVARIDQIQHGLDASFERFHADQRMAYGTALVVIVAFVLFTAYHCARIMR